MVSAIFESIGSVITAFAGVIGNGFTALLEIFYSTSGTNAGLTPIGILSLIGVGMGLVYWAFNLVRGLIKTRG